MTASIGFVLRRALPVSLAGLLAGLVASACDLPDKSLGDDDPAGTTGEACEPGDTMMQDCNTCECIDGAWTCTDIACSGSSGGADSAGTCEPGDEPPIDDCNTCECVDGLWQCTAIGCAPTDTGTDTDEPDACNPIDNPTNGCNTCECDGGEWSCTDQACPEEPLVELCGGSEPNDLLFITGASIMGDTLTVSVEHSGGCVAHGYGSCWDGSFAESDPVQTGVQIWHEDNDDPCEAVVMRELTFNLTPIREAHGVPSDTIIVHVDGWGSLDYVF